MVRMGVVTISVIGLVGLSVAGVQAAEDKRMIIAHYSDLHAAWLGTDARGQSCLRIEQVKECTGGVGRLQTAVNRLRAADVPVFLLNAGDEFEGAPFYNLGGGAAVADIVDRLQVDAMAPGNHDFTNHGKELGGLLDHIHVPVLAANVKVPVPCPEAGRLGSSILLERDGIKLGVVGLANPETPTMTQVCPTAEFQPAEAVAQVEIDRLKAQGADAVVLLTHLGLENDIALASQVRGVAAIVGGHRHLLLSNDEGKAFGPYPELATGADGNPVLVVTASYNGSHLGQLDMTVRNGVPVSWSGGTQRLNPEIPADSALVQSLKPYADRMEGWSKEVIATSTAVDDGHPCRTKPCSTGQMLSDALLRWGQPQGAEFVLLNGGGFRAPLLGDITRASLMTTLPFENQAMVIEIPGKTLLQALEYGLSGIETEDGAFPQVSGLTMIYDLTKPAGQRLQKVTDGKGNPIDPARTYHLATIDYLYNGGNGYTMLSGLPTVGEAFPMRVAMEEGLKATDR